MWASITFCFLLLISPIFLSVGMLGSRTLSLEEKIVVLGRYYAEQMWLCYVCVAWEWRGCLGGLYRSLHWQRIESMWYVDGEETSNRRLGAKQGFKRIPVGYDVWLGPNLWSWIEVRMVWRVANEDEWWIKKNVCCTREGGMTWIVTMFWNLYSIR